MGGGFVRIYLTVGTTLGTILAVPPWQTALAEHSRPSNWTQAGELALPLLLATAHGVLRMYSWLPSAIYYLGFQRTLFEHWLFNGW